jgi:excinuclease ABC subunit C
MAQGRTNRGFRSGHTGPISEKPYIAFTSESEGARVPVRSFLAGEVAHLLEEAPAEPGVYMLRDDLGQTIYVGKSSNLRKRVRSHFGRGRGTPVARVEGIEYIVTESELEALILECNLIKRLRPLYNSRLKDDKSYPYIRITTQEEFPSIGVTRSVRDDGSVYLGPYADVGSARKTIRILREVYPLRRCRRSMERVSRPCLDYHIRRCLGPCTGGVDPAEYRKEVEGMIEALMGRREEILDGLRASMEGAAARQEYERAAVLRDRLKAMERTTLRQRLASTGPGNADILGISSRGENGCVQMLFLRESAIIDQEHFMLDAPGSDRADLLSGFLKEYYSSNPLPPRIIMERLPEDSGVLEEWFSSRSTGRVDLHEPLDDNESRLVSMASRNADLMLKLEMRIHGDSLKKGIQELARALDLADLPKVIEAFDLSNTAGKDAVGSMVRFRWGRPNRSLYRRYRIKWAPGRDDYAMMREVVSRRFRSALNKAEALPDLVVVDGGPGQASAARTALEDLDLDLEVVGLAKRDEKIFKPGSGRPIPFRRGSPGHMLLRRIRDEAHRHAVGYHRSVRGRAVTKSELDGVRGIGPVRKSALLRKFGSVDAVRRSDVKEISTVPGIGPKVAGDILDELRGRRRARVD